MKNLAARLAIALVTFAAGVCLSAHAPGRRAVRVGVGRAAQPEVVEVKPSCARGGGSEGRLDGTAEEKAVRAAEEFIARNGYTDLPPDRDGLSYESVERAPSVEEMLRWRHDSLERKAYGVLYSGRARERGWLVAFRHRARLGREMDGWGRAVTMDRDFKNLLVEHKPFPLANVDKKL